MAIKENSPLGTRILNAVSKENPELFDRTKEKLKNYTGGQNYLKGFLELAGTYNPYRATEESRIIEAIWKTSSEKKAQMRAGEIPVHGTTVGGHRLVDQFFAILPKYGASPGEFGAQSITKIFSAWGNEEQANKFKPQHAKQVEQRIKNKEAKSISTLGKDLEAFLENPSLIDNVSSTYARYDIRKILRLDDEIQKRLLLLDTLINSDMQLYDPKSEKYILSDSSGGGLWKWFEKTPDLPEDIMNMYATYKSPIVDIDDNVRDKMRSALILYSARNRRVSTNSILSGAKSDIDFYQSLPENHELRKKIADPKLYRVRPLLQEPTITLEAACEVLEIFDFVKMRKIINRETLNHFQEELTPFLDSTRKLYVENKEMLEDSLGSSVPWKRIKETDFGRAHTVQDHQYIKEFHRMEILTTTTERLIRDIPVKDFNETITHLVIAKRKFDYLLKWKEYNAKSNDHDIIENFEATHNITINEFLTRVKFLQIDLKGKKFELENKNNFGLYSTSVINELSDVLEKSKKLAPYSADLQTLYAENSNIISNPLIIKLGFSSVHQTAEYTPAYISLTQKQGIESMPIVKKYLDENINISNEFRIIRDAKYFDLPRTINLGITDNSYNSEKVNVTEINNTTIVSAEDAREEINRINENYKPLRNIPDFRKKAYDVFDISNRHILVNRGYEEIFPGTWYRLKEITQNSMISNLLVDRINELHSEMFSRK